MQKKKRTAKGKKKGDRAFIMQGKIICKETG